MQHSLGFPRPRAVTGSCVTPGAQLLQSLPGTHVHAVTFCPFLALTCWNELLGCCSSPALLPGVTQPLTPLEDTFWVSYFPSPYRNTLPLSPCPLRTLRPLLLHNKTRRRSDLKTTAGIPWRAGGFSSRPPPSGEQSSFLLGEGLALGLQARTQTKRTICEAQ